VHTADGVAHILARGDNHSEGEQYDAGDAPVQAEHWVRRSKSPFVIVLAAIIYLQHYMTDFNTQNRNRLIRQEE
jgi:hypothetical protein